MSTQIVSRLTGSRPATCAVGRFGRLWTTREDRYGHFTVLSVTLRNGKLGALHCTFVTWQNTED